VTDEPDDEVTLENVCERLIIHGTPSSVADKLLAFEAEVGRFGTLLYAGSNDYGGLPPCAPASGIGSCLDVSGNDLAHAPDFSATLIYEHSHYPYRQIRQAVQAAGEPIRREIIDLALRHRGGHDEMLRPFCAGQQFRFDILMDVGGFRDMHRHRRCIQIGQEFTTRHGYDAPQELEAAGVRKKYDAVMQQTAEAVEQLASLGGAEAQENSQYAIPLGFRKRTLFKMDFAEVVYISELRTGPAGHFSYRNVAYAMYQALAKKYPALAKYLRVHDVREPVDLLKR